MIRERENRHFPKIQRNDRMFQQECPRSADNLEIGKTRDSLIVFFHINAEELRDRLSHLQVFALPNRSYNIDEHEIEREPTDLNGVIDRIVENAAGAVNAAVTNYCRRPFEETSTRSNHSTTMRRCHEDFDMGANTMFTKFLSTHLFYRPLSSKTAFVIFVFFHNINYYLLSYLTE